MHSSRARAKGVSASSFVDLTAEVAKQVLEAKKAKAEVIKVVASRPDKVSLRFIPQIRGSFPLETEMGAQQQQQRRQSSCEKGYRATRTS